MVKLSKILTSVETVHKNNKYIVLKKERFLRFGHWDYDCNNLVYDSEIANIKYIYYLLISRDIKNLTNLDQIELGELHPLEVQNEIVSKLSKTYWFLNQAYEECDLIDGNNIGVFKSALADEITAKVKLTELYNLNDVPKFLEYIKSCNFKEACKMITVNSELYDKLFNNNLREWVSYYIMLYIYYFRDLYSKNYDINEDILIVSDFDTIDLECVELKYQNKLIDTLELLVKVIIQSY